MFFLEQALDQQLVSYIGSQFGASFAELDVFSGIEKPVAETLDILGNLSNYSNLSSLLGDEPFLVSLPDYKKSVFLLSTKCPC
jgi:hypothetical protein